MVRLGVEGLDEDILRRKVSLINDHDRLPLHFLIRRVDTGQPRWKFETRPVNEHGPRKPHQAYCNLCFRLTGVRKFDKEFMAYRMEAK